jgi:hypothetical protein
MMSRTAIRFDCEGLFLVDFDGHCIVDSTTGCNNQTTRKGCGLNLSNNLLAGDSGLLKNTSTNTCLLSSNQTNLKVSESTVITMVRQYTTRWGQSNVQKRKKSRTSDGDGVPYCTDVGGSEVGS